MNKEMNQLNTPQNKRIKKEIKMMKVVQDEMIKERHVTGNREE